MNQRLAPLDLTQNIAELPSDLSAVEELRPVPPVEMDHALLVSGRSEAGVALVSVQRSLLDALHAAENSPFAISLLMPLSFDAT